MSSEPILCVDHLSKTYRTYRNPRHRLGELLGFHTPVTPAHALEDVSFTVRRGEILGVIGPNGAGKSTLLQMIAGTLKPSAGSVSLKGRVTALLELGAGVDVEMTGRENIALMGATYGLDRDAIRSRIDEVAAFSELGAALDNPVKTYSSGMFLRLAFSVSTALQPDLLIVDEALAVGDVGFQARCLDRLRTLIEGGASILLASHDLQLIKGYCTKAICLHQGKVVAAGDPEEVVEHYYYLMRSRAQGVADSLTWQASAETGPRFQSDRGAIETVDIERSRDSSALRCGEEVRVVVRGRLGEGPCLPAVVVMLRDARGYNLYGLMASSERNEVEMLEDGRIACRFRIPLHVAQGEYSLTVRLEDRRTDAVTTLIDKRVGICHLTVDEPERRFLGAVNLFGGVEPVGGTAR